MAVAKMGGIVTEIAGSIGETTFRRQGPAIVVYNKPKSKNKQKLRDNEALSRLRQYSNDYANLTSSKIDAWAAAGQRLTYTDRFGNARNYRPRELYISVHSGLEGTGQVVNDPSKIIDNAPTPIINEFAITKNAFCQITLAKAYPEMYAIFQLQLLTGQERASTNFRYKKLRVINAGEINVFGISESVEANYTTPLQATRARIYVTLVNKYGMRGTRVSAIADVVPE